MNSIFSFFTFNFSAAPPQFLLNVIEYIKKTLSVSVDVLGFYSYRILFWIGFFVLLTKYKFLFLLYFVIFYYVVNFLVKILKPILRGARPENMLPFFIKEDLTGLEYYGMPSGHAAASFYVAAFLWVSIWGARGLAWLFPVVLFICLCAIYQRYVYRRHTALQLLVGALFGAAVGKFAAELPNAEAVPAAAAKKHARKIS